MQEVVHQLLNFQMISKKFFKLRNHSWWIRFEGFFNRANYVEAAIQEVYKTLVIAFILVVLIIYLFRKFKGCIVPAIALPVSLIASFLGLYIFGLSINIFVLLSFILAIGIITDDSVIMTDAIYRRIENGETPLVAAYKGLSKSLLQ